MQNSMPVFRKTLFTIQRLRPESQDWDVREVERAEEREVLRLLTRLEEEATKAALKAGFIVTVEVVEADNESV